MAIAYHPYHPYYFSRAEYYAIVGSLDSALHYELWDGSIYAVSPANPPHAGVVTFCANRLRVLDGAAFLIRVQDVLEIGSDGAPEPDVAIVRFRNDYYSKQHPNGGEASLVIEIGDAERNPRGKTCAYMRDGRIPLAWRTDIPGRCVERWITSNVDEPVAILRGSDVLLFESVDSAVDEMFSILDR